MAPGLLRSTKSSVPVHGRSATAHVTHTLDRPVIPAPILPILVATLGRPLYAAGGNEAAASARNINASVSMQVDWCVSLVLVDSSYGCKPLSCAVAFRRPELCCS